MSDRDPYVVDNPEGQQPEQIVEYLSRELRRIQFAFNPFEETLQVTRLEQTANADPSGLQLIDCSTTAVVVTLPSATRVTGKEYVFKKVDPGANKGAIRAVGTETIDGEASASLTAQYQVKHIISDGTNWHVL